MRFEPSLWVFLFTTLMILLIILLSWRKRVVETGKAFLILMGISLIWVLGFTLEMMAQDLIVKVWMFRIQIIGMVFLPIAWLYLILNYVGIHKGGWSFKLLYIVPIATIVQAWLPRPNWFWHQPQLIQGLNGIMILDHDFDMWYYFVHIPYSGFVYFIGLFILFRSFFNEYKIYRKQSISMMVAMVLPLVTEGFYLFDFYPSEWINLSTVAFGMSALIMVFALFRYRFLDLIPMARNVIFENMEDGIIVIDYRNRMVDLNPSAEAIANVTQHDIGKNLFDTLCFMGNKIQGMIQNNQEKDEMALDNLVYEIRLNTIRNQPNHISGYIISFRDITEKAHLFERVREQAAFDHMTGLLNRAHFYRQGEKEISKSRRYKGYRFSVMIIDMNKFKEINDSYGHAAGDKAIVTFSDLLKDLLRDYDVAGRMGGDEFGVILSDMDVEQAKEVGKRLLEKIEQTNITIDEVSLKLSISIGVVDSGYLEEGEFAFERLVEKADELMYQAKKDDSTHLVYE